MDLREIIARLKLKYKIVDGTIYAVFEKGDTIGYPTMRPAFAKEISQIQARETLNSILEAHQKKKEPVHPPRPPRSPYEEE